MDYWARGRQLNPYCDAQSPGKRPPNHIGLGMEGGAAAPAWVEQLVPAKAPSPQYANLRNLPGEKKAGPREKELPDAEKVLGRVREVFMRANAIYAVRDMARVMQALDSDGNGIISIEEFQTGMAKYACNLTREEVLSIWDRFSAGANGPKHVNLSSIRAAICGSLNKIRMRLVQLIWHELDDDKSGWTSIHELMRSYNPKDEPLVMQGKIDRNEAQKQFLDRLDKDHDGMITETEFTGFMTDISATCESDEDFTKIARRMFRFKR